MKEYGVDNPTLTDNFSLDSSKKAEINSNALSTRCYLSTLLLSNGNKKPKYAAIANRRDRVIIDCGVNMQYSTVKSLILSRF